MKFVKNLLLAFVIFLIILFLLDIFLFRGFLFINFINRNCTFKYEYVVKELPGEQFHFKFEHKGIWPHYIWTYRNNEIYQNLTDSLFFQYASRIKVSLPYEIKQSENIFEEIKDYYFGFHCGTGLGGTTINPYEKFEYTFNYKELLDVSSWNIRFWNHIDTFSTDVLYNKRIYAADKRYELDKNLHISEKDSLEFEFYVPVFCLLNNRSIFATSNKIKISYLDLLKYDVDRFNRYKNRLK